MRGRLSILRAALVVARRDFVAILFSRSFIFFLIGPLFMLAVSALASGVGQKFDESAGRATLGVAMSQRDADAILSAARRIGPQLEGVVPDMVIVAVPREDETVDAPKLLAKQRGSVTALLTGTPAKPVLTGAKDMVEEWQGSVSLLAAQALRQGPEHYPAVTLATTASPPPSDRMGRMRTAQAGQTLLFLLTMLLAGMVLSNLVEEKANKIIEILAAAVPMDAVFLGKLFAMLAVSFVGIAVWGVAGASVMLAGGKSLSAFAPPAVGWTAFILLGIAYFGMAYLLLGSIFLTIGSMAATVREVQTLSMPVTMLQLLVFFFASYAVATPHSGIELAAVIVPFSSPYAMLARAALEPDPWQHVMALGWQIVWVALFVRFGAQLFRRRVMKSGPAGTRRNKRKAQPA